MRSLLGVMSNRVFTNPEGPDVCKECGMAFEAKAFNLPQLCPHCDLMRKAQAVG
jgi:predicted Zn-ribbon and HTH transcriptional regulator